MNLKDHFIHSNLSVICHQIANYVFGIYLTNKIRNNDIQSYLLVKKPVAILKHHRFNGENGILVHTTETN